MVCSPRERADVVRSFNRLVFAAQDMAECRGGATFLMERMDLPGDVRRALETGIPVAYSRPWTKSRGTSPIGPLGKHWLPPHPDQVALHKELLTVRNRVYAHTDDDCGARWVADVSKMLGVEGPAFVPAWRPSTSTTSRRSRSSPRSNSTDLLRASVNYKRWASTCQRDNLRHRDDACSHVEQGFG